MAKYIDKDALVAEIESKKKYAQTLGDNAINSSMRQFYDGVKQGCVDILSFIDTFQVKEVDLEKCYHDFLQKEWFDKNCSRTVSEMMAFTAKHFFELGMAVSNPVTAADRGHAIKYYINSNSKGFLGTEELIEDYKFIMTIKDE